MRFALAVVLLTSALLDSAPAQKQPKLGQTAHRDTNTTEGAAPLPLVRHQPSTEQQPDNVSAKQKRSSLLDFSLTDVVIAGTGIALLFVGCAQLKTFNAQKRAMQKQLVWMRRANERVKEQIKLARDEFNAAHLPRHSVRDLEYLQDDDGSEIRYAVRNVGSSPAQFLRSNVTVTSWQRGEPFPEKPPFDEKGTRKETRTLAPGDVISMAYVEKGTPRFDLTFAEVAHKELFAVLMTYIDYADKRGITHRLVFSRLYDVATKKFEPISQADYNYEE